MKFVEDPSSEYFNIFTSLHYSNNVNVITVSISTYKSENFYSIIIMVQNKKKIRIQKCQFEGSSRSVCIIKGIIYTCYAQIKNVEESWSWANGLISLDFLSANEKYFQKIKLFQKH